MNVFRLVGDVSHLLGMLLLLCKICTSKSCTGVSGKTQVLFSLVFTARYIDLFMYVVSIYNSVMKVCFISVTYATVYVIYVHFKSTNSSEQDTFRLNLLALAVMSLALVVNYRFSLIEILWTFSIYLESVAIVPQIYLSHKIGRSDFLTGLCLFVIGGYRGNYIFNWIYRYHTQGFHDHIAVVSGFVQVFTSCFFLFVYFIRKRHYRYHRLPALLVCFLNDKASAMDTVSARVQLGSASTTTDIFPLFEYGPQQTEDAQDGYKPNIKYVKLGTTDQELEHI